MNLNIKLIISFVCLALIVGLGWFIVNQNKQIRELNQNLEYAITNNKAYEAENSTLNDQIIEFKMTAKQLSYSRDSLTQKLNNVRNELKIKDKQIKELQYIASENRKRDTVRLKDTIFVEGVALDTLIQDKWSSLKLQAQYPNLLNVDYSFNNSTMILTHTSRVTVDPPKKCWIARLFQKKHTIVEIDVIQENPYCTTKEEKFIEIIDK